MQTNLKFKNGLESCLCGSEYCCNCGEYLDIYKEFRVFNYSKDNHCICNNCKKKENDMQNEYICVVETYV
jgi:hypothetical protein